MIRESFDITDCVRWGVNLHCCYAMSAVDMLSGLFHWGWMCSSACLLLLLCTKENLFLAIIHYWKVNRIVRKVRLFHSFPIWINLYFMKFLTSSVILHQWLFISTKFLTQRKLCWNNWNYISRWQILFLLLKIKINLEGNHCMLLIRVKCNSKTHMLFTESATLSYCRYSIK